MLRRDYLERMIEQFSQSLETARLKEERGAYSGAIDDLARALSRALNLSPHTLLSLNPSSLLTMVTLSQISAEHAVYLSFLLYRMAQIEEEAERESARLRYAQAQEISEHYGFSLGENPFT